MELVSADLLKEGSFDLAAAGCEYVCHVASPPVLKSKNPQKDIVDPALTGTRNVFSAILKAKCARRVVVTSSLVAVFDDDLKPRHVYTEEDWNEKSDLKATPYPLAKTLAEKTAWDIYRDQPNDGSWRFELVTMLPGVALGPILDKQHLGTSPQVIQQLLNGTMVMAPDIELGLVDVRDVADAHVAGLENPGAAGRFILNHKDLTFLEVAKVLKPEFKKGYRVPGAVAPNWLCYLLALVHPQANWEFLRRHLGIRRKVDNSKVKRELGIQFRPIKESILDTAWSIVDLKLVHA